MKKNLLFFACLLLALVIINTGWRDCLSEYIKWTNEDCVGAFKAIDVPVITINADYGPTAEDNFRKYLTSYDAKYISGSGHVVIWDATETFNKLLLESIEQIIDME